MRQPDNANTLSARTMRERMSDDARERMEAAFIELLGYTPEDNLRWEGSKIDLVELVYAAYMDKIVIDGDGCPATFSWLISHVFGILHVGVPANPRSYVARIRSRKGVRQRPFLERYALITKGKGHVAPMDTLVGVRKPRK